MSFTIANHKIYTWKLKIYIFTHIQIIIGKQRLNISHFQLQFTSVYMPNLIRVPWVNEAFQSWPRFIPHFFSELAEPVSSVSLSMSRSSEASRFLSMSNSGLCEKNYSCKRRHKQIILARNKTNIAIIISYLHGLNCLLSALDCTL